MIRYRIDVISELKKRGFNSLTAKNTGLFGQSTMQKFKSGDTSISLENLNRLCAILDMQPLDIIEYVPDKEHDKIYMAYLERIKQLKS